MPFASDFQPPLKSFLDAVYIVGSSLVTVGLSQTNPAGTARWVVLGAGFCGLAVMTMAVTYLLEVQSSVARRDTGIIKLNTSAGQPAVGAHLARAIRGISKPGRLCSSVLEESRDWCATVRQSHSSHPSLIYFQSVGTGAGWPAALGRSARSRPHLPSICSTTIRCSGPRCCCARKAREWPGSSR